MLYSPQLHESRGLGVGRYTLARNQTHQYRQRWILISHRYASGDIQSSSSPRDMASSLEWSLRPELSIPMIGDTASRGSSSYILLPWDSHERLDFIRSEWEIHSWYTSLLWYLSLLQPAPYRDSRNQYALDHTGSWYTVHRPYHTLEHIRSYTLSEMSQPRLYSE